MVNHVLVSQLIRPLRAMQGAHTCKRGSLTAPWRYNLLPRRGNQVEGVPMLHPHCNGPEPWKDKLRRGVTGVSRGMTHKDLTFVDILGKPGPGEGSTQKAPKSVLDKLRTIALSPPRREV